MKRFFDNLYSVLYYQFPIDTPAFHYNWPVFSCNRHRTVAKGFTIVPLNLIPHTVFHTPVKIMIPFPAFGLLALLWVLGTLGVLPAVSLYRRSKWNGFYFRF